MNRKTFLRQLGGAGALTLLPITSIIASSQSKTTNQNKGKEKVITSGAGKELSIFGNKQLHKLVGKDTDDQFFEWTDYLQPGAGTPPHVHTKEDEVFRVTKGSIAFMIGDKTTILKAGDIALAPKNIPHSWKVIGDQEAQMNVTVFPAGMEFMFEELNALPSGKPDFEKVAAISATYGIRFV